MVEPFRRGKKVAGVSEFEFLFCAERADREFRLLTPAPASFPAKKSTEPRQCSDRHAHYRKDRVLVIDT